MAYTTTFIEKELNLFKDIAAQIGRFAASFGARLVEATEAHERMQEVLRLSDMSDEELAVHGLTRDDIVSHVFRDKFCY
ncbi:hypothetical protein C8J27_107147 [Rhodobacter aestuarii]|uniref:DUF1127 domain-containing protein n=1 Tax=Rhodobacter aestuarii TaxID=453582 RepID=A0A1N7NQH7_9RHOB|nr:MULTISPECIES: DUF1127 domain-containing protein [Rhodobacter]PTV94616.1 hypothetical protein C8J27_107147 [Rhodobacter aestuarii]SIT00596.1 hypothetical protein SAMN05421580_10880 [Rhodobacter aestuarii]SOC12794.1 hypothetical protein SAMN05877809_106146 [Rhodobacter sp. JA431]